MISPSDIHLSTLPWVPLKATNGFPEDPAIYFAIDSQGVVQYIGRSVNVRTRWKNHHRYEELEQMEGVKIAYLFIDTPELLPSIESALIDWFDPPLNVVGRESRALRSVGDVVSKVAELRGRAGLTQRQLADLVGVTESTIRNLERNRNGVDQIERLK
jgi:DNA-binding XRE family transcriptional regulator